MIEAVLRRSAIQSTRNSTCRLPTTLSCSDASSPHFIHHPGSASRLSDVLRAFAVRDGQDVFRGTQAAVFYERQLPDHRHRVRVAPAPRHLVFGGTVPDQLVDADLSDQKRQLYGVPPSLLERAGRKHVVGLQLLRVEHEVPRPARRSDARQGHTTAASSDAHVDLSSTVRLICPPGGLILFSAAQSAFQRPEHVGPHPIQRGLPNGQLGDLNSGAGAPNLDSRLYG